MAQKYLRFNSYTPPVPDEDGYTAALATTSTADSERVISGVMKNTPLFTVEAYSLKWTNISAVDVSRILKEVLNKSSFSFYHFNIYTGVWETSQFYAANFNMPSRSLVDGRESWNELSFQVTKSGAIRA